MRSLTISLAVLVLVAPALADWDVGDPHKMHYPQLPDPFGWDVRASYYLFLADDWQCSQSGPVTDIHLWVSFRDDLDFDFDQIHTAIWTDDRSGTFSKPLDRMWHKDWDDPAEYIVRPWHEQGDQGWYDPETGEYEENDHVNIWQINLFLDPTELLFYQVKDEIYWLEVSFKPNDSLVGWKTSPPPHFEDDAVWRLEGEPWVELVDPITQESLDLAFVITPEPAAISILVLGGVALLARRRRR